jgi:decaprenylphospho-beta-D-erythro-pentofuranosid-2-ulose 2-reductase
MLRSVKSYSTIVLLGSTSEIGLAILRRTHVSSKSSIIFIGRAKPLDSSIFVKKGSKIKFIQCDITKDIDLKRAIRELKKIPKIDLLILASGYLPDENLEFDKNSVRKTIITNALAPIEFLAAVAKHMVGVGTGDILIISSVAITRARTKNFTYGASKATLDFYASGLANKLLNTGVFISILRPGFVYTKMTKNFTPAPFPTNVEKVAKIAVEGLFERKQIIYAPKKLKYVMKLIKALPKSLFDKIDKI